jgi:tetratricopeptide (TPR) repeat protein
MAKTAADRARSVLDAGEPSPALRVRVDRLVSDIAREQSDAASRLAEVEKDRKLIDRLNEVRLDPVREDDPQKIDADYATAFRGFGVDVDRLDPGDAGRALAKRSDPQEIALFLDDWALLRREYSGGNSQDSWRRLVTVARAIDQDPWRDALRKHIDGGDDQAVRRLATDRGALAAQPARSLYLLARALELCQKEKSGQSSKEPIEILELAWRISPGDYQICSQLGRICESKTDRIRFRTAAVTMKPDDARAHSLLGDAYVDCSYRFGIAYNSMCFPPSGADAFESRTLAFGGKDGKVPKVETSRGYEHSMLSLRAKDGTIWSFGPVLGFVLAPFGAEELTHALAEYKEAVRLKPSNPYFRVEYGDAMVLQGDIKGALAEYREAARLAERDNQLHEHIAQVFFVKGELDLAIAEMQEQIRLYPQPRRDSLLFLGIIYQKQGKKRLAFAAYRDVLLQGSLGGNMFLRLALETTGTPEDLFRAYRDAVRTHPGDSQLQREFLSVCLKLGTTSEVQSALEANISVLREKARLQANNPHLRLSLGAALSARGDRKEAAVEFRKALELMQKDPAECNEVAWTLATSSQANQRYGTIAVEFAIRACELTAWKDANYLDTLAAAHAEAGDFDSAVRRQTEAISLLSDANEKEDLGKRLKLYRDRKPFREPR